MDKSLLISEVFPPRTGGSGRWFWELYRRLPLDQYHIVAGQCPGCKEFDQASELPIQRLDLSLSQWGLRSLSAIANYVRLYGELGQIIKQQQVSSLHAGRLLPEGWLAWLLNKRYGLPYLCYVHGEELFYGVESRELGWMMRCVFASARMVIANSENTRGLICDEWQVPHAKTQVVHPGVDTDYYCPAKRDPCVRQQLGWHDRHVIVSVGRLQKRKGHDVMIRAIADIRRQKSDVLYSICGDGEEREGLEQLVDDLDLRDHVQFRGEVKDAELLRCYQQSDLFVLANRTVGKDIEGFGIVLLEAQSCGVPVIAGDSGGTAETMHVDQTGYIVNCDDHHELVDAVLPLLSDDDIRMNMGQSARQWVVENFDWHALANETYQLFSRIAASNTLSVTLTS